MNVENEKQFEPDFGEEPDFEEPDFRVAPNSPEKQDKKVEKKDKAAPAAPAPAPQTLRQLADITGISDRQLLKTAQLCEILNINPGDAILPLIMLQIKSTAETEAVPPAVKTAVVQVAEKFDKICEEKTAVAADAAATAAAKSAVVDTKKLIFRALAERDKTPSAWGDRITVLFCVVSLCFISFFAGNAATQFSFTLKICQFFGFYL